LTESKARLSPAWLLAIFLVLVFVISGVLAYRSYRAGLHPPGSAATDTPPVVAGATDTASRLTPAVEQLPDLVAQQYAADGAALRAALQAARAAYAAGNYPAAVAAYRTVVMLSNGDGITQEAFFQLGAMYDDLGQYADAAFCYHQAQRISELPVILDNLALTELHRGDAAAAAQAAMRAAYLDPRDGMAWALLAAAREQQQQLTEALAAIARSCAIDSTIASRVVNRALLAARTGDTNNALRWYQQALLIPAPAAVHLRAAEESARLLLTQQQPADAVTRYKQALRLAPDQARLQHHYGVALAQTSLWSAAVPALRQALASDPNRPLTWYALAESLAALGRNDEAIAACQRGIELDPENVARYYQLAVLFIKQNRDDDARRTLEQLLTLQPPSPLQLAAIVQLANIAARRNDLAAARQHLAVAADLAATEPWLLYNRGIIDWRAGEKESGYRYIEQAIDREPRTALFRRTHADLLFRDRRYADAIVAYQQLLAVDSGTMHDCFRLGWLLQQQRNLATAAASFRQADRLPADPDLPDLPYVTALNLAAVLADLHDYAGAQSVLRDASRREPGRYEAYHNAALISVAQGRRDEAMAFLQVARRVAPQAAPVALAEGWLLWERGLRDEAAAAWERAHALDPTLLAARYNLELYRRQTAPSTTALGEED